MRCRVCHRRLTDPVSVQVGIGPVCRERVGIQVKVERECKGRFPKLRADLARRVRPGWQFQTELVFDEGCSDERNDDS